MCRLKYFGRRVGVLPRNIFTGSVYPSNIALIGLKLWGNAFQTICNFRFFNSAKKQFDAEKKIADAHMFLKNCFFLKIWPSKSGDRQLRRPNSLPRMRFSGLCDASPARNINFCVFLLDLGRKKTSLRVGANKESCSVTICNVSRNVL